MITPRLYLDVDGVLAAVAVYSYSSPEPYDPAYAWSDWETIDYVPVSRSLASALGDLPADRVWLTTWTQRANEVLSPYFGWPQLEVLDARARERSWWKLDALIDTHPRGVPFVWVDDELARQRALLNPGFDAALATLGAPYLLVCPLEIGASALAPSQVDEIRQFLSDLR